MQIIELPDEAALDAYMADPRRLAAAPLRDRSVARTEITESPRSENHAGSGVRSRNAAACRDAKLVTLSRLYLSTSPTTKNIEPRIATRSATTVPPTISGSTATLLNDAVRSLSRHGVFSPRDTR